MRFMIMVKATQQSEAGLFPDNKEQLIAEMASYHEAMAKAGVLLDGSGLKPSSQGLRITWSGGKRTITDGPFAETKELIAGYTLIQVASREEAIEWAKRMPAPDGSGADCAIELRPLYELEDLGPSEQLERFRQLDMPSLKPE